MKFGILASHQFFPGADLPRSIGEVIEIVQLARELGYDSVFTINHFLGNLHTPQTISMTARLIDHSGTMQLGTGILVLPLFHPVHVAEEFATLDQLSGGRVILGVGAGYRKEEFNSFGIDIEHRGGRLSESIQLIRALWTDERVTYTGKHFTVQNQRIGIPPLQKGGPKIWVGAAARLPVQRAAAIGDSWFIPGSSPGQGYLPKHIAIYDEALARNGKPVEGIERPILKEMFVDEDGERARRVAVEHMKREYAAYGEYEALQWFNSRWQELVENALLVGTPAEVIAKIEGLAKHRINHVVMRTSWAGMDVQEAERNLKLFAEKVAPRFKARGV
jgi:alkanesulfonate monooxygenase SsuD/methylene tetrahydromethanopterin reductase-like flavin-dependent oxidoreductase (luciferase family)